MYVGPKAKGWNELQGKFTPRFDPDRPRAEISDKNSKMREHLIDRFNERGGLVGEAGGIFEHPELFKQYPHLKNLEVVLNKQKSDLPEHLSKMVPGTGSYQSGEDRSAMGLFDLYPQITIDAVNPESARDVFLHEIQHAIQDKEDWARGGSPESASSMDKDTAFLVSQVQKEIEKAIELQKSGEFVYQDVPLSKIIQAGGANYDVKNWASNIADKGDDAIKEFLLDTPYNRYQRLAGEVEARDTAARKNMSLEERMKNMPYEGQGIPLKDIIVKRRK
jgi:hypothetical protein